MVNAAVKAHRALGQRLLEGVYERSLVHELTKMGLKLKRQVKLLLRMTTFGWTLASGWI
jgi:GxxExxY protein